jgi:hypothetical protein
LLIVGNTHGSTLRPEDIKPCQAERLCLPVSGPRRTIN